jgi:two-component system OmpR family sensor kinase
MGRLFWKFFVSYWAALLVAVLGVGTAAWLYHLTDWDTADRSLEAGPRARFMLATASATLRHGGLSALRDLLEEPGGRGESPLLAVDEGGRDLLGRAVPAAALDRARRLVAEDGEPEAARRVSLADGRSYLLFVPEKDPGAFPLLRPRGAPPSPLLPLAIGTLASLGFGALLAWYVARPIRHLREAFAALSEGRLETRVAPLIGRRRDEVADLGRDFDGMAQRLQALIAAQRSLLHDVSHELRSPLARLQAAIGLLRQNPQRLDASLERIEQEAERLDELVGELLTLSRLEAGGAARPLERRERVDLVDLVASITADAHFEAEASRRAVVFSGEGELPADARVELLHRAVENVVRNAVKFTAEGTAVEVSVARSPSGDAALVTVADRGPGVSPAELESIFEPFYRGAGAPPGPGFGLGLAIARRAVEAHGGRVRARNRPVGGLQVEIELPLAGSAPPP